MDELVAGKMSVRLDDLSCLRLRPAWWMRGIVGNNTDPAIAKAIGAGSGYGNQLRELARRGTLSGIPQTPCRAVLVTNTDVDQFSASTGPARSQLS